MLILGIETSCDETAIAILEKTNGELSVLANVISSQIELHATWGGVVPNLAAREHLKNIIPVLKSALQEADKKMDDIDLIAVTHGPGLIPALLIGTNFAKTLSYLYKKPLLGIHHIEGHIYANFIGNSKNRALPCSYATEIKFPILSLVVSGGHTQLILMTDHFQYQVVGETQDDAAGEAFDKVARLLGLGYPGGPVISAQALNHELRIMNYKSSPNNSISNIKEASKKIDKKYTLPRPMLHSKNFDFSFSGLKTAVLYKIKNYRKENDLLDTDPLPENFVQEMAYEFQEAATDVLVHKTIQAAFKYNPQTIFLAGGVSANNNLRQKLGQAIEKNIPQVTYQLQDSTYSTDNAAMIAIAASYRWEKMTSTQRKNLLTTWQTLSTNAQLSL